MTLTWLRYFFFWVLFFFAFGFVFGLFGLLMCVCACMQLGRIRGPSKGANGRRRDSLTSVATKITEESAKERERARLERQESSYLTGSFGRRGSGSGQALSQSLLRHEWVPGGPNATNANTNTNANGNATTTAASGVLPSPGHMVVFHSSRARTVVVAPSTPTSTTTTQAHADTAHSPAVSASASLSGSTRPSLTLTSEARSPSARVPLLVSAGSVRLAKPTAIQTGARAIHSQSARSLTHAHIARSPPITLSVEPVYTEPESALVGTPLDRVAFEDWNLDSDHAEHTDHTSGDAHSDLLSSGSSPPSASVNVRDALPAGSGSASVVQHSPQPQTRDASED